MKLFNFFNLFIQTILIFSFALKTLNAMHESDCESQPFDLKEENCDSSSKPATFEDLPAEIKLIILEKLILRSENLTAALKNIVSFANVYSNNRAIVKESKALHNVLIHYNTIGDNKFFEKKMYDPIYFSEVFELSLFKLIKNENVLEKIANRYEINKNNLKILILFIAISSNYKNFFELIFEQLDYEQILDQEAIYMIYVIAKIQNKTNLIDLLISKNLKIQKQNYDFEKFINNKISTVLSDEQRLTGKGILIAKKSATKVHNFLANNLQASDLISYLKSTLKLTNSEIIDFFKMVFHQICLITAREDDNILVDSKFSFYENFSTLTALLTCERDYEGVAKVKVLISQGFNLNEKHQETGANFLEYAAEESNEKVVKFLIENGIQIDHQNNNGATALIMATMLHNTNGVKLLLDYNADYTIVDHLGHTALDWAQIKGYQDIIELLQEAQNRRNI